MKVSSSHFFVIQSTPPMSASGLLPSASNVKLQLSRSQSVSSFAPRLDAVRRPDFYRGGQRAHFGSADQQMEPPVSPVIRERLVARVDDGAIELRPLINVVDDVVSALAELKIDVDLGLGKLKIECERVRLPDAAGAGENLARGEKGEQRAQDRRSELRFAFHQIILVAAKG